MRSRTLVMCFCLLGAVALAVWGVWSWGPGAFDRRLTAGERALATGQYERAVRQFTAALALKPEQEAASKKLELAQGLVESDQVFASGKQALEAGDYAGAEALFATVRPEHPSYPEAERLAAQCHLAGYCASLSRNWAVERDLLAGKFTLAVPGGGTLSLVVLEEDDDGSAICSLKITPLPGTSYAFPGNLRVGLGGGPFPVDVAGEGRFVVCGYALWAPPKDPVVIFPVGSLIGWALSPDSQLLAGTYVLTTDTDCLVETVVTDLGTLEAVFVDGPYSPGASMPPDWLRPFAEVSWAGPRQLRYERFEGEDRSAEVRYADIGQ